MKYIDAEKLIAETKRLKDIYPSWQVKSAMDDLCDFITSLHQEQPEVDLDAEITKENEKWTCYEEFGFGSKYDARPFDGRDITRIARHFYELGKNARKEE